MITPHLKKLRMRAELSSDDERVICGLVAETQRVRSDEVLICAGQDLNASILLLDGWMVRSKDRTSGKRQVVELHVAGDFVDLHGFTLKRLDHDVVTVSDCTIGMVPHERLREISEHHPHLLRVYWLSTNIDASITREMALSLGQRSAISRMAHLFCELHVRLDIVGKTDGNRLISHSLSENCPNASV